MTTSGHRHHDNTDRNQTRFYQYSRFLRSVNWPGQPEQEQGLLRIAITVISIVYLLMNWPGSNEAVFRWTIWVQVALGFLVYSSLLLAATLVWPKPSTIRRIIGVLGDIGVTTWALHLTGSTGAPWYGVYLWVTLGNGFRYGENYLYLSGIASLVGFGAVVTTTSYWTSHRELAIGLMGTLLVIPAYCAVLIRRLNEARQRADAASRAKSEFLSRMSHEIRTPLNGILGMTDLLRTRPLEPEDRAYVETIHASGKTLSHQIDEILDLSKIEAGKLLLEELEFDLYALINTTLRIFEPQVHAKQIQLQESINPNTPFMLRGDPHKLRQIVMNLLSNAIKFTNKGFVSLRVYPREQDVKQVLVRFEVADTGSGISPGRLENIFEPFAQADSSVSRSHGGTGLGTTICKQLVELMGGEIGVRSAPDVGTTFWFDIPFETAKPQAIERPWTTQCNVIYLRGERHSDSAVEAMLRDWRMPFRRIYTPNEATQLVHRATTERRSADVLIIDAVPYSSEIQRLLSQHEAYLPLDTLPIVLTGADHYPPEITAREHDYFFALKTPVDKRVLFNTLHACYTRHSTEDDIIHIAHKQTTARATRQLNVLIGDDNSTNRLVLERMLKQMGHQCVGVTGGEEVLLALELDHYDVAIVDKNMPDMSGIEVFKAYNMAHGRELSAKFVILTADATAESRDACVAAGIDYFLTKPVSLAKLHEALSDVTRTIEPSSEEWQPAKAQVQDYGALPVIDELELDKLKVLGGDDANFLQDIIGNFANDVIRDMRGLEVALANHDWMAFKDSAHALKGAAMYLGLERLAKLSMAAQNLSEDEFQRSGILQIQLIQKAADAALRALREHEIVRKSSNR